MPHRNTRIAIVIVVIVLIAGLAIMVGVRLHQPGDTNQVALGEPSQIAAGPETSQASETTEPATSTSAGPESCPSDPQPIASPVQMTLIGHGMELPMLSLGMDASGAAPEAPPGNEGYTVAWFNQGPLVGSSEGKAVLSSHTFQYGGALGNQLNNGLLSLGDIVKISGSDGSAACYRYSGSTHVMVADYDPTSDILYDYYGDPKFALIVCSDYTSGGDALGRMIYYGDLIGGDEAAQVGGGS